MCTNKRGRDSSSYLAPFSLEDRSLVREPLTAMRWRGRVFSIRAALSKPRLPSMPAGWSKGSELQHVTLWHISGDATHRP